MNALRGRKVRLPHVIHKVIAEIGAIGQVKNLEDRLQRRPFVNLEVFGNSRVKLEECLPTNIIEVSISIPAKAGTEIRTRASGWRRL